MERARVAHRAADTAIASVAALEVLDSRGRPTLSVEVQLAGGVVGRAIVPSGASTGAHEAVELRDGGSRYRGKGVRKACEHVEGPLAAAVRGLQAGDQAAIDRALAGADGTPGFARLGANAVLGISLANAHAAAAAAGVPLYRHFAALAGEKDLRLPVPLLNVLNGGAHADNGLDIQEFMIVPVGFEAFADGLRAGAEIYQALRDHLLEQGMAVSVGDEGGFAPRLAKTEEALDALARAVEKAGYRLGEQVVLALDVAATELYAAGRYRFEGALLSADDLVERYARWAARHPIQSIEDGLAEDDWAGWQVLTRALGDHVQLVGDDLFVTNPERVARGRREGTANAVLIKPNQIGTTSATLACVRDTHAAGWAAILSHRSGDTEDTTIADLAVGLGVGQIKTGAPCRGERTAKYNRLLAIEAEAQRAGRGLPFGRRPSTRAGR